MAKKERVSRTITSNVTEFEELVSVKRSIYPWADLTPGGNFFIACDDEDAARALKSSVNSSGLNYYLKRKIKLIPIVIVAKMKDGGVGVLASVIKDEDKPAEKE